MHENALYKFTFDIDIDLQATHNKSSSPVKHAINWMKLQNWSTLVPDEYTCISF